MDLLVSGPDRSPRDVGARLLRWRAPRWAVVVVTTSALLTTAGGVAAVGDVGTAAHAPAALGVQVTSTVAVRGRGPDGVLLVRVSNHDRRPVELRSLALRVDGVAAAPLRLRPAALLSPGAALPVELSFRSRPCDGVRPPGVLRLVTGRPGEPDDVVDVPVREGARAGEVPADAVVAGCRPVSAPGVVALDLTALGGQAARTGAGAVGMVLLRVRNAGGPVELLRVTGQVPGAQFASADLPAVGVPVPVGAEVQVLLSFGVADCRQLRRTGRVVVTVRDAAGEHRELGFRATGDGEARTLRDVDLDLLLGVCPPP